MPEAGALLLGACVPVGPYVDKMLPIVMRLSDLARSHARGDVTCKSGSGCHLQIPCSRAGCSWDVKV